MSNDEIRHLHDHLVDYIDAEKAQDHEYTVECAESLRMCLNNAISVMDD